MNVADNEAKSRAIDSLLNFETVLRTHVGGGVGRSDSKPIWVVFLTRMPEKAWFPILNILA